MTGAGWLVEEMEPETKQEKQSHSGQQFGAAGATGSEGYGRFLPAGRPENAEEADGPDELEDGIAVDSVDLPER